MDYKREEETQLLTVTKAAAFLGVSPSTIRKWTYAEKINGIKIGSRGDWRYTKEELLRITQKGDLRREDDLLKKLQQYLNDNADAIEDQATQQHKEHLGVENLRNEYIEKYQQNHRSVIRQLANSLLDENEKKNIMSFRKLGQLLAEESLKDGLTIEEAVNGTIFLKQTMWKMVHDDGLLQELTLEKYYQINQKVGIYIDVLASEITITYHQSFKNMIKNTEEKSLLAEKRYYNLLMQAPMPIAIVKGPNHIYELSNAANNEAVGKSIQAGMSAKKLFSNNQELLQLLDTVYKTGEPHYGKELPIDLIKDEKKIRTYVNFTYQPIRDIEGDIEGVMVVAMDVTEQVLAREIIQKSEERLRKAIAIETVGVLFFRTNGEIIDANDAFLRMSGYTREDLKNGLLRWDQMTPKKWMSSSAKAIEEFKKTGRTNPYEKEYIRKDGSRWWGLFAASRLSEDEGVEFVIDISKQKMIEQRKDDFIALSSHEFKTPVTSLKMYAQIMENHFIKNGDKESEKLMDKMSMQIKRLINLVEELLNVSRIQVGKLQYKKEPIAIDNLVTETVENLQKIANSHKIILDGQTKETILGDPDRMGQVLTNLINNAVKYSPNKDKIIIFSRTDTDRVVIGIQDFGIGIPKDEQNKIFERFYQANTDGEGRTYSGLGLGLYISKEIIEYHGGKLWLESEKGKGTTFYFSLPIMEKGDE